jgi:aspartate-semialdehyde dehydrogenase
MSCAFARRPTPDAAIAVLKAWRGHADALGLPSSPAAALTFDDAPDHPQPRRDALRGGGMTVSVGRVRPDPILDLRLVAMGHNTVRGAAGGSILNAELLASTGAIPAQ